MTRGVTLLELMVAVAILGLLAAVSGVAIRSLAPAPEQQLLRELAAAHEDAVQSGRNVVWLGDSVAVRFLPNGSSSGGRLAAGARTIVVDPLTGGIGEAK